MSGEDKGETTGRALRWESTDLAATPGAEVSAVGGL